MIYKYILKILIMKLLQIYFFTLIKKLNFSNIVVRLRHPKKTRIKVVALLVLISILVLALNLKHLCKTQIQKEKNNSIFQNDIVLVLTEEINSIYNYPLFPNEIEEGSKTLEYGYTFENHRQKIACVKRPQLREILFSNKYWQVLQTSSGINYYIYNAYLDTRVRDKGSQGFVRIQMTSSGKYFKRSQDSGSIPIPRFCQFWYLNRTVEIKPVVSNYTAWSWGKDTDQFRHLLLSCKVPQVSSKNKSKLPVPLMPMPISVSLVMNKCDSATNNIKIVHNVPPSRKKKDFGICFKMLDYPVTDISRRVVELVELLRILGVSSIHFPYLSVHPQTMKVLRYYESTGFITLKKFSLSGFQLNSPLSRRVYLEQNKDAKRKQEIVPYNDCFLMNIYHYRYIGIMDFDEVLLPVNNSNYQELFRELEYRYNKPHRKRKVSSFGFRMKQFLERMIFIENSTITEILKPSIKNEFSSYPEITKQLYFDKAAVCSHGRKESFKSFHDTDKLLLIHNHYAMQCLEGKLCRRHIINMDTAYIHHHRKFSQYCHFESTDSLELLQQPFDYDPLVLNFRDNLITKRDEALAKISIFNKEQ